MMMMMMVMMMMVVMMMMMIPMIMIMIFMGVQAREIVGVQASENRGVQASGRPLEPGLWHLFLQHPGLLPRKKVWIHVSSWTYTLKRQKCLDATEAATTFEACRAVHQICASLVWGMLLHWLDTQLQSSQLYLKNLLIYQLTDAQFQYNLIHDYIQSMKTRDKSFL